MVRINITFKSSSSHWFRQLDLEMEMNGRLPVWTTIMQASPEPSEFALVSFINKTSSLSYFKMKTVLQDSSEKEGQAQPGDKWEIKDK